MIVVLTAMGLIVWVLLQTRDSRVVIWKRRAETLRPFTVTIRGDIKATWQYFRSFKLRQVVSPSWWRERLQFRKLWSDFDTF